MTTTHVTTTVPATSLTNRPSARTVPWRSSNGRIWIGQSVLAVLYVMAAVPKLNNDPHTLTEFADVREARPVAPLMRATKASAARPHSRGITSAIAPATSRTPIACMPAAPMPRRASNTQPEEGTS